MSLPIVTNILYYAPETALLQLDSLNMLLQVGASAYPSDITDSKEYPQDYHALLVLNITGPFQYHSINPIYLTYLSYDFSSFTTSLSAALPPLGPTSVPNYTHWNYTSDPP